jgi:hypothetical protein
MIRAGRGVGGPPGLSFLKRNAVSHLRFGGHTALALRM